MTTKEMFELPRPHRRCALIRAVERHVLGVIAIEDIQYRIATAEEKYDGKIPAITETQILYTDALYSVAYAYEDQINKGESA
jgi:hypothetical protein